MSHSYPSIGHVTLKFCQDMSKIKNPASENLKLFMENQPANKIGLNNDKQIKLYETDGAVRTLLYLYQRVMPV